MSSPFSCDLQEETQSCEHGTLGREEERRALGPASAQVDSQAAALMNSTGRPTINGASFPPDPESFLVMLTWQGPSQDPDGDLVTINFPMIQLDEGKGKFWSPRSSPKGEHVTGWLHPCQQPQLPVHFLHMGSEAPW